jgi:hypothetical protein
MELYALGRTLHVAVGVVTLASFWVAAGARKGSRTHRRAGVVYLLSIVAILGTTTPMLVARLRVGDTSFAGFFLFLMVFLGTSAWLTWASIRRRASVALLTGGAPPLRVHPLRPPAPGVRAHRPAR